MTPIGSTSSNIRRAIELIVHSSRCSPGAPDGHSRSVWTVARRGSHRRRTMSTRLSGRRNGARADPEEIVGNGVCTVPGMPEIGTDWRVVDGVATVWFDAPSLIEAAALAGRIVELSPEIVVDVRATGMRVRLDSD